MTQQIKIAELETVLRMSANNRTVWLAQSDDMVMIGRFRSWDYEQVEEGKLSSGFYIHTDQMLIREANGHSGSTAAMMRETRKSILRESRVNLDNYPPVEEEDMDITLPERETFINATNIDRVSKIWIATSFDPVMQRKFEKVGAVLIEVDPTQLMRRYFLDWDQILFRKGKKQISEETKIILRDRLEKYREQKNAHL